MEEYKATNKSMASTTTRVEGRGTGAAPPKNVFKVNVDGAIFTVKKQRVLE